jgi:hypothetical protein
MKIFAFAAAALIASSTLAGAQSLVRTRQTAVIDSYTAFIGPDDLENSRGIRLTKPWQIIRQDRANVHERNLSDDGDEIDGFFSDANNRQALETMLARGSMSNDARQMIVRGNCWVNVQIFGRGDTGDYVEVEVWR